MRDRAADALSHAWPNRQIAKASITGAPQSLAVHHAPSFEEPAGNAPRFAALVTLPPWSEKMTKRTAAWLVAGVMLLGLGHEVAFAQSRAPATTSPSPSQPAGPPPSMTTVPQQTPTFNDSQPNTAPQTPEAPVPSSTPSAPSGSGLK
jgi:hypothetical protein